MDTHTCKNCGGRNGFSSILCEKCFKMILEERVKNARKE